MGRRLKQLLIAVIYACVMTLTLWLVAGFQGGVGMAATGLAVALIGSAVIAGAMIALFKGRLGAES